MSDDLGKVIRRDIDNLPLIPTERWVPTRSRPRRESFARVVGVAAVLALTIGIGLTVGRFEADRQSQVAGRGSVSKMPQGLPTVTRQQALASVRELTAEVVRWDRIEAKLVQTGQVPQPTANDLPARSASAQWVVAVGGDLRCSMCLANMPLFHNGMYSIDASTGVIQAFQAGSESWPASFDMIVDEALAPDSVQLTATVDRLEDGALVVVLASDSVRYRKGERMNVSPDGNTAYAWIAGRDGGSAFSLSDLQSHGLKVGSTIQIMISESSQAGATHTLERLIVDSPTN